MTKGEHQRVATWVITRCTPEYQRDSLIGDLLEQYEERGSWWYWRQALGAARTGVIRLVVTATQSGVPAAEYIGDLVIAISMGLFALNQLPVYAEVFLGRTPLMKSTVSQLIVSAAIGAVVIAAATAAHEIRMRMVGAT